MRNKAILSIALGAIFLTTLFLGLSFIFFQSISLKPQQTETTNPITLPDAVYEYTTREMFFSAQVGDRLNLNLQSRGTWLGQSIVVEVRLLFGTQVLYGNIGDSTVDTLTLPETGTYTIQIENTNNFSVRFDNLDTVTLHHPNVEYIEVKDTSLQPVGTMLIVVAIVLGIASLLVLAVGQAGRTAIGQQPPTMV